MFISFWYTLPLLAYFKANLYIFTSITPCRKRYIVRHKIYATIPAGKFT